MIEEHSIGNYKSPNTIIYSEIQSTTIVNTTTEGSLLSANPIIPAYSLSVGSTIRLEVMGIISVSGNPVSTINMTLNGNTILASTGGSSVGATDAYFHGIFLFTVRSVGTNGTLVGSGHTIIKEPGTISQGVTRAMVMTTPITIDTTIPLTFDLRYKWDTASLSNTITLTNAVVEVI